jgi:hypothetical protein
VAHFSVSSAMNLPKSAGEVGNTVLPKSANRASIAPVVTGNLAPLFARDGRQRGSACGQVQKSTARNPHSIASLPAAMRIMLRAVPVKERGLYIANWRYRRSSSGDIRPHSFIDRVYQDRKTAGLGGNCKKR